MNLSQIPKGEIVLLDANIVLYAIRNASRQCENILRRCADQEIFCAMTSQQFAETMHRLMIAEAIDNHWISGTNPAKKLSEKPDRIRALHRYEQALRDLMTVGVILQSITKEDFVSAFSIQRQFGLMTNDALLVACAVRLGCRAIATADKRLKDVTEVVIYVPDDLKI